jgi:hypothetical protein
LNANFKTLAIVAVLAGAGFLVLRSQGARAGGPAPTIAPTTGKQSGGALGGLLDLLRAGGKEDPTVTKPTVPNSTAPTVPAGVTWAGYAANFATPTATGADLVAKKKALYESYYSGSTAALLALFNGDVAAMNSFIGAYGMGASGGLSWEKISGNLSR